MLDCWSGYSVSSVRPAAAAGPVGGSTGVAPATVPDGCPRCGKRVYEAEKKVAVGKVKLTETNTYNNVRC